MEKLGLKTLVINADTIATSRLRGENLWGKADEEPHMIFLALEQLVSKEFGTLVMAVFTINEPSLTIPV